MTVENVVVRITTSASTRQIREARKELLKLAKDGQLGATTEKSLSRFFDKQDKKLKSFKAAVNGLGSAMAGLNKITLKLFTIGFAIGSAALAANNALFAVGRFSVKLYQAAMQGLVAVMAAVGAAVATVAAAMNEYTAAVNAYSFKSSPTLKNKLSESSAALRNIESDATLATFGMQALSGAFAGIAKNSQVTGASKTFLKGLADFAAAGGDPAKQIAAAGEFIGLLQKSGKLDSKVMQAASALGEPFVQAMKKAKEQGMDTIDEFKKMLTSGELARLGGVEGQAGLVGSTLMGQIKALGVRFKSLGVDFGQSMLGPVKAAIEQIFRTIESMFARIGPEMIRFGRGEALGGIVSAFEKIEDFMVRVFRKYLTASNGLMSRFLNWWDKVLFVVRDIVDRLRTLLSGGSVIIDSVIKPVFELVSTTGVWIRYIADIATRNERTFLDFGQSLTDFVHKIQELGKELIDAFVEAMPFLNQVLDWAGNLLDVFMDIASIVGVIFGGIEKIGGGLGSDTMGGLGGVGKMFGLMGLAAVARAALGRAGVMPQTGALNSAGTAIIGAPGRARDAANRARMDREARRRMTPEQRRASNRRARGMTPKGLSGLGPAAALAIGSMFASEEAQGFMQTGSMIAMMAPVLGPVAAMAGVGLAGMGMMRTARTAKGGALGGAMTGGAIGAAIGSVIPAVGTAIGAVVGAAIGAVVGYFKGKANSHKFAAQEAAAEYMEEVYGNFAVGMVTGSTYRMIETVRSLRDRTKYLRDTLGTFRSLKEPGDYKIENGKYYARDQMSDFFGLDLFGKTWTETSAFTPAMYKTAADMSVKERQAFADNLVRQGKLTETEATGLAENPEEFLKALDEQVALMTKVAIPTTEKFNKANQIAFKSLGMTTDELTKLAMEKGVNLFDMTVSLQDQFVKLGLAMNYTADQIRGAIRDIAVEGLKTFDTAIRKTMSPHVMDELAEGIYSEFTTGGQLNAQQLGKFIQDMYNQLNLLMPNAPLGNIARLREMYGEGGTQFRAGMQLEGLGDAFANAGFGRLLDQLEANVTVGARDELTDMIAKQGLFGGVAIDRAAIERQLAGMDARELDALSSRLAGGAISPEALAGGTGNITAALSQLFGTGFAAFSVLGDEGLTPDQMLTMFGEDGVALIQGLDQVMKKHFENTPSWYSQAPEWYTAQSFRSLMGDYSFVDYNNNGIDDRNEDTATPRGDTAVSRSLRKTLGRHGQLDSMVTGSRSITSSYRTDKLGSINSDHIMGKAYDLVGQNLGAYATLVNKTGGFAEFHGTGGSRHLHVVPGEGAVGDSTAPYMGAVAAPSAPSSSTNYYNIEVNGSPGMDVSALADAVMDRIQRVERSNRERS